MSTPTAMPASTPATTPAPSIHAPSTPAPAQPVAPAVDDPFSKLDQRAAKPKEKPAVEPAKVESKTSQPQGEPSADLKDPRRLRSAFDLKSAELVKTKTQLTELEKKLQAAESKGADTSKLTERIAAVEKERDTLQGRIQSLSRGESAEFKAKFVKPFNEAAEFAKQSVEKLEVTTKDDDGNTTGARAATWDDFGQLYAMPFNKAIKLATAMFGEAAPTVINHISELQRLDFLKRRGLDEEEANFKANQEKELADNAKKSEAIGQMWTRVNQDLLDRHPEWQATPDDKEGAEILKEGYALADSAMSDKTLTLQQKVILDANIRHRAAIQPFYAHQLKQSKERITELESTIAELKGSRPGATQRPGGEPAAQSKDEDWRADLRKSNIEVPG